MEEIDGAIDEVVFFVNGRKVKSFLSLYLLAMCHPLFTQVALQHPDPEMTLLYFLRNHCKL